MSKADLLAAVLDSLGQTLERLTRAAREAHAAATDPGSKAESKYDTRSLEASYLAAGQARQVDELADALARIAKVKPRDFELDEAVEAGALVEVDLAGESQHFLLLPAAGGTVLSHEGMEITLLSPDSALYRRLLGLKVGDSLDEPPLVVTELS